MGSFEKRVRVLTLNIAHGRGLSTYQGFHSARGIERSLRRLGHMLRKFDADIVALQEVDEDSHWNQNIHLLDVLQAEAGYPHAYLGVHNRRSGKRRLAYGNGVLTKYPIHHAEHEAFGRASLGEKGFACVELETPHGILPLINLHLDFRSRLRRVEQVERLIRFLDDKKYNDVGTPHLSPIVCGDFNSRVGRPSDAVRHLLTYLSQHCAYRLFPEGKQKRTFPSLFPLQGLDFIFVPPMFKVIDSSVIRTYVSDHRPVLVDLDLAPSEG